MQKTHLYLPQLINLHKNAIVLLNTNLLTFQAAWVTQWAQYRNAYSKIGLDRHLLRQILTLTTDDMQCGSKQSAVCTCTSIDVYNDKQKHDVCNAITTCNHSLWMHSNMCKWCENTGNMSTHKDRQLCLILDLKINIDTIGNNRNILQHNYTNIGQKLSWTAIDIDIRHAQLQLAGLHFRKFKC